MKTNYSEVGAKFPSKTGRSPREIFKEVSAQEPRKKGVFTKSHHKKMVSSNQTRKMDLRRLRHANQTLDVNAGNRSSKSKANRGITSGLTRPKNHSFKRETGEYASVSRKNFGKVEYQTNMTGKWRPRDRTDRRDPKGKPGYAKKADKAQLDSVMPDCVSIYKKLKVQAMPRKGKSGRKNPKSRETEPSQSKKDRRKQSKVTKKNGQEPPKAKEKVTPEKVSSQKQSKTRSRDQRKRSKRIKKRSQGKSFEGENVSRESRTKKSKSRKKNASAEKKKLSRKNTFQSKKGASKKKGGRAKKTLGIRELNSKVSQTMSKAERTTSDLGCLQKKSLKTSRVAEESSSHKFREKSQKFMNNHFQNRLRRKEQSRGGKPKAAHSLQKSLRKDSQLSRSKRSQKASKKKSMVLKNLSELTKGLSGQVKVIYKANNARKKARGLYTEDGHVFADLKEGVERDQFMAHRHSKLIYKKGRTSRKQKRHKHRNIRELSQLGGTRGEDAPNIYSQKKGNRKVHKEGDSSREEDSAAKFINVNEKRVRIWATHGERSIHKRRKLVSNRKFSGLNRTTQERKSNERAHKSNLKARKEQSVGREHLLSRGSLDPTNVRKVGSQSELYAQPAGPGKSKTNIYQKVGSGFKCPESGIEFDGANVQNSIYLKSEEAPPEEGTAISEKTDNSLACREHIGNGLRISQSPNPLVTDSDRRGRQSTQNVDADGNEYFERDMSGLDYAKSEDLEADRRLPSQNQPRGQLTTSKGAHEEKLNPLETKETNREKRKMKLSQSEAGNWKGLAKAKFKGVRSGDLGLAREAGAGETRVASPELGSSPQRVEIEQGQLYKESSSQAQTKPPQMEFEVDPRQKFDSKGKANLSSSNKTNKFDYGEKMQSNANLLGESDFTIGNKISLRAFGFQSGHAESEQAQPEKAIRESSEEGEDLIISDSVTLAPELDLEAHEQLPQKDPDQRAQLEACESLDGGVGQGKSNYLTLKEPPNILRQASPHLSEKNAEELPRKASKKKPRAKHGKRRRRLASSRKKREPGTRSNSKVKLYKMTSEKHSTLNHSVSRSRKESKTKWSGKKINRKKEIGRLLEKYSRENNAAPEKEARGFDQVTSKAFSLTFRKNLHQKLAEAKAKPAPKAEKNREDVLRRCREFKHDTQSNLFEVETLNTLTLAEDDYVAKPEYLNLNQPFLDAKVRTVLMGWMGEVSEDLWFCRDTFHMACNYVDRFLQLTPNVPKDRLQLIGLTCLYIASKMEEVQMRNVNDYLSSACNIYTEEQMMRCEIEIITRLDFRLNPPTLNLWANWYMNQWDNFIMSDSFVQEHPMVRDSRIVAQFKQGNEDSYNLYREFMQYLGEWLSNRRLRRAGHPDPRIQAVPAGALVHVHRAGHEVPPVQPGADRRGVPDQFHVLAGRGGVRLQQSVRLLHVLLLWHRAHRPAAHDPVRQHLLLLLNRAPPALDHRLQTGRNLRCTPAFNLKGHYEQFISYQIWNKKSVAYVAKLRIPEH